MTPPRKYNTVIINALLAVVACLVINFSYLLAMREQDERDFRIVGTGSVENESITGQLHISRDGYGYILVPNSNSNFNSNNSTANPEVETPEILKTPEANNLIHSHLHEKVDSIYVVARLIRRLGLRDGCTITVVTREPWTAGGNPLMWRVLAVDGRPFEYGDLYNNPRDRDVMMLQLLFYVVFGFVLLTIMTVGTRRRTSLRAYMIRLTYCLAAAVVMWFLLPVIRPRSGELTVIAVSGASYPIELLKCSFVVAVALLYGRVFQLIYQRERILLENEQLKNENLTAHYNTLVGQINPHFLFNSLNSLAALVREGKGDDAVRYIDRLADTFRYSVRSEPGSTTTLGEELEFVAAYKYLLEVRYEGKLFIDIDVEEAKREWRLPTFSIQPLIENAVKHNSITRARPLRISIRTQGDRLIVSNPINPKIEPESGTGIGLQNLSHRLELLTGRAIEVTTQGGIFTVSLPFL